MLLHVSLPMRDPAATVKFYDPLPALPGVRAGTFALLTSDRRPERRGVYGMFEGNAPNYPSGDERH